MKRKKKKYAVYKNGRLITCLYYYDFALSLAVRYRDTNCSVTVIDMEDGVICYYWNR